MALTKCVYTSSSVNPLPECLSWGENGLIAFGSCNAIFICDSKLKEVKDTLVGHHSRVNCVKWVKHLRKNTDQELISGSCDNTIKVWSKTNSSYCLTQTLDGHNASVTTIDGICLENESSKSSRTLIASASADSTVRIWQKFNGESFSFYCLLEMSRSFSLSLYWAVAPNYHEVPILFVAGDDSDVKLFAEKKEDFKQVLNLRGHEDWVRCLDVKMVQEGTNESLMIASSGQDAIVRLWTLKEWNEADMDPNDIRLKAYCFSIEDDRNVVEFAVVLESVLLGHEGCIYSVCWQKYDSIDINEHCLLTASMDKTIILWKQDVSSGIWMDEVRVGEVGGNTLGFYGGLFSPQADAFLGYDYQGAIHLWRLKDGSWIPSFALGGHFRSVEDISWDMIDEGYGVVSVSQDQTTRLHAPWVPINGKNQTVTWQEMARPQIHGYDMSCISVVAPGLLFVSGAEEKVLRVFRAPLNFLDNIQDLCGVKVGEAERAEIGELAVGAAVPALGLSNKAVLNTEDLADLDSERIIQPHPNEQYGQGHVFKKIALSEPPLEFDLLQNTLWPELQKLYGHGNDVFCIVSSRDGSLVASACKASQADQASILLWGSHKWHHVGSIDAHSLTVTQLAFSKSTSIPSTHLLLSVSRDRTLAVTKISMCSDDGDDAKIEILFKTDKRTCVHARIIWACDWSHDDSFFVTASRDKKIVCWKRNDKAFEAILPALLEEDSCTAVACAPCNFPDDHSQQYLIAVGVENGSISLNTFNLTSGTFSELTRLPLNICHHLTVKKLRFRPFKGRAAQIEIEDCLQLASCGADGQVRVFEISYCLS